MIEPIRVLLIEDDFDSAHALSLLLRHQGFEVDHAHSVSEARMACAPGHASVPHYDVVLLDLSFPDGDGEALASELSEMEPAPAVIVHSAAPDAVLRVASERLGAHCFIRKPSDGRKLIECIHAAAAAPRHDIPRL